MQNSMIFLFSVDLRQFFFSWASRQQKGINTDTDRLLDRPDASVESVSDGDSTFSSFREERIQKLQKVQWDLPGGRYDAKYGFVYLEVCLLI